MGNLSAIIEEAVDQHPDSVEATVDAVYEKANNAAWFKRLAASLVHNAITELVHRRRHALNVAMRKAKGEYGGPPDDAIKVGEATAAIARGVHGYMIAGKTLGMLTGDELVDTATDESNRAAGHEFNVRLCTQLAKKCKGENTVEKCFTVKQLQKVFENVA